jgi:hypothetical protein
MRDNNIYSPLSFSNRKCLVNLYKTCIVVEDNEKLREIYDNDPITFIRDVCPLCLKSFRLREGLKYKYEHSGERVGVTL